MWNNQRATVEIYDKVGLAVDVVSEGVLNYNIENIINKLVTGNKYHIKISSVIGEKKTISCDFYIDTKGQLCCKCC